MYIIDSRPTSYIYVMFMCGLEFFVISCLIIEIYMSKTHTHLYSIFFFYIYPILDWTVGL